MRCALFRIVRGFVWENLGNIESIDIDRNDGRNYELSTNCTRVYRNLFLWYYLAIIKTPRISLNQNKQAGIRNVFS